MFFTWTAHTLRRERKGEEEVEIDCSGERKGVEDTEDGGAETSQGGKASEKRKAVSERVLGERASTTVRYHVTHTKWAIKKKRNNKYWPECGEILKH